MSTPITTPWFPQGGGSIIEMDYRANEEFVLEVARIAASMVDIKAPSAPAHYAEMFDMVLQKTRDALPKE